MSRHRNPGPPQYGMGLQSTVTWLNKHPKAKTFAWGLLGTGLGALATYASYDQVASPAAEHRRVLACAEHLGPVATHFTRENLPDECWPFEVNHRDEDSSPQTFTFDAAPRFIAQHPDTQPGINGSRLYWFFATSLGTVIVTGAGVGYARRTPTSSPEPSEQASQP